MGELGKIAKRKDVSLEIKAEIIHTLRILITMYRCKSGIVRKADRKKKLIHMDLYVRGELYRYHGPTGT